MLLHGSCNIINPRYLAARSVRSAVAPATAPRLQKQRGVLSVVNSKALRGRVRCAAEFKKNDGRLFDVQDDILKLKETLPSDVLAGAKC